MSDSSDIIKELPNLIKENHSEILAILFAHRDWIPTFADENNNEIRVIIDGINFLSDEDKQAINNSYENWTSYVISKLKNSKIDDYLKTPTVSNASIIDAKQLPVYLLTDEMVKGLAANLMYHCLSKYAGQNDIFNDELIKRLSNHNIQIIKPWVQIGFCRHCNHFDLLFSSTSRKFDHCRDCGTDVPRVRIYKVNDKFAIHKQKHKDLPIFIESYILKQKPHEKIIISYRLKKITNQDGGDIDVFIPSTKTGIECKIFGSHQTPQGDTLINYRNNIENSLRNYLASGEIDRFIVITNLSQYTAEQIKNDLLAKFKQEGFDIKYLQIGYFSIENLFSILQQEISLMP